jgi:hypothetical protein
MEASLKLRNSIRALAKAESNPESKKSLLAACDVFRSELKEAKITLKVFKLNLNSPKSIEIIFSTKDYKINTT